MVKTKTWVFIIVCIFILSAAACLWLYLRPAAGRIANVYVDGQCVKSFDLDSLTEAETFVVSTSHGENVILAEPGRVRIIEADCPDQICVNDGWLSDSAAPIVCLPHRVVIELSGEAADGLDTVAR